MVARVREKKLPWAGEERGACNYTVCALEPVGGAQISFAMMGPARAQLENER